MSPPRRKARSRASARRRLLAVALIPLSALALAACGETVSTEKYKGEEKAVAQRISEFQSDATASDQKKVCENDLAAGVKAKLASGGSSCREALKHQLSQIDTLELKIRSIAVTGKTAVAHVTSTWSGKTKESIVALNREGTAWRISALQ
jgi:microcompartment protein CcmK/EutM